MASEKEFKVLKEKGIKEGDYVKTKFRGGVREGVVDHIDKTTEETPHPPKVVFTNQKGKQVSHNPSVLTKVKDPQDEEDDDED